MSQIRVTIDGREIITDRGQTILDVCKSNDIHVPTLCHYSGLKDVGACRLCIVEVEGARRPIPSCTSPAEDEMVIRTKTDRLHDLRQQTLELIFGERNHICPFCPRSGNCDLQTSAYHHGMDHVRYDYLFPQLPVDNSHARIALDHNRCILCTRCVRACDEWIGAHVLDLDARGSKTMLVADDGIPLGESSCVSCGTCVAVCPTGALFEKRSAHWQGRLPKEHTQTICPGCGVGCRINASVRHRQIGEIVSAGGPSNNRVLCERGRFGLVNPKTVRIDKIRGKRGNKWVDRSLQDIVTECANRLSTKPIQEDPKRVIALMSPRLPLETMAAVQSFMTEVVGSDRWSVVDRSDGRGVREALDLHDRLAPLANLDDLDTADMFLMLGCNLEHSHGVIASYVRRGVLHRRARLVDVNPRHTWLTDWTDQHLTVERGRDPLVLAAMLKYLMGMGRAKLEVPEELVKPLEKLSDDEITAATGVPAEQIKKVAEMYAEAKNPMIICGRGLTRRGPAGLTAAMNIVKAMKQKSPNGRWRLMETAMGANTVGGRLLGDSGVDIRMLEPQSADVAFVVLGDDDPTWERDWIERLRTVSFVVVLVAREHDAMELAHVVIPTATWAERGGTYVNLAGCVQKGRKLMEPPGYCVNEVSFFEELTKAWRGPYAGWSVPEIPEMIRYLADGHMVPCQAQERPIDFEGLQTLTQAK